MKVEVTIAPVEIRVIEVEGADYESAKAAAEAQIPEGWRVLQYLPER
ncbi:hypothetical protein [Mycetocola reblochoni]|uniref:Uncharacterized protein n=1 Tax=Mycetocola reblochoni REB411 TaxID=1255698 RepID=A0A1R4IV85_9MICO|nr:hypothetical protein [Mycetocola reblochoni]SJN23797.1 hypothetical protein FM119_03825 [Mycetocola reblochoni REB411]